jgi:hypothetical protein
MIGYVGSKEGEINPLEIRKIESPVRIRKKTDKEDDVSLSAEDFDKMVEKKITWLWMSS